MSDTVNEHDTDCACDLVDYAIVSHTNTPVVPAASQLPASRGARVRRESLESIYDAAMDVWREFREVFFRRPFD